MGFIHMLAVNHAMMFVNMYRPGYYTQIVPLPPRLTGYL